MNGKIIKQSFHEAIYTIKSENKFAYVNFIICSILSTHYFAVAYGSRNGYAGAITLVCIVLADATKNNRLFRGYKLLPMSDKEFHIFSVLSAAFSWLIIAFLVSLPAMFVLCYQARFSLLYLPFTCLISASVWSFGLLNFKNYNLGSIHKILDIICIVTAVLWLTYCLEGTPAPSPLLMIGGEATIFVGYFFYHYMRIRKYTIDELNFEGMLNSKSSNLTGGHL